ncbi:hypothetical protein JTE90_020322 [Oedothorax gibbosus]|uniref:Nose resistant-to-fluoxetine protein N-terminal domain-containing protein n=1 Tax=Oedothorax gibbosus TaxID=931172 RepID=A0AAV6VP62_9ARAC|nr:hypothetical protein JTE90_020322 [Oedothorax gibbosus]
MYRGVTVVVLLLVTLSGFGRAQTEVKVVEDEINSTVPGVLGNVFEAVLDVLDLNTTDIPAVLEKVLDKVVEVLNGTDLINGTGEVITENGTDSTMVETTVIFPVSVTENPVSSSNGNGEKTTTATAEKSLGVANMEKAIDDAENVIRSVESDLKKRASIISDTTTNVDVTTLEPTTIVTESPKQTYKEAEKEITDFVNSILRSLLPKIVGGSGGAKLSPRCTGGMMKVFGYIRRMKGWTLKMIDSMGKPSSGILKGTAYSMGDYDQCLDLSVSSKGAETTDIKEEMFRGKYCRVRVQFPQVVIDRAEEYHRGLVNETDLGRLKDTIQAIPYNPLKSNYMSHFLGMCVPSTCTDDDLKELVKLIPFPGKSSLDKCEVKKETEVDSAQLVILCLFMILVLFAAVSTFIDWILHSKSKEKSLTQHGDKRCVSVSVAFSFCNNTKKLFKNIEDDTEGLMSGLAVRGVFVASIAWIVMGHTYLFPQPEYYFQMSSFDNLRKYWDEGYFTIIMSFPFAIETLFVCYGFLFTFSLWQPTLRSRDVNINVISLIIKNYLRFCLPLLILFGVIFVLPLIGSGPFWGDLLQGSRERCRTSMGSYFLMYSNFLELEDQCFPHLWFVSCLGQLTFVGIFLSWILSRNIKIGLIVSLIIWVICNGTVGIINLKNHFPPSYVAYFAERNNSWFWKINMSLPLIHFGSYVCGMLAGILVARKDYHRCRKILAVIGWIACLGVFYALGWALYTSRDGSMSNIGASVFASLHKTAFAICVAWVVVACSYGMGGFVNSIFSCRIFDPLFRLSYYAYIFHYLVISFVVGVAREHFSYHHMELILRTCSYIAATYIIAYIFYLLLEMPLKSLKSACCPKKTCQLEVTTLNNFPSQKEEIVAKNSMEVSCKLWSVKESENGVSY